MKGAITKFVLVLFDDISNFGFIVFPDPTTFYRGMMSQLVIVVERYGWNRGMEIGDRVVTELEFWRRNLRDLNSWEMRASDKVMYCRDGQVKMFSNASDRQVGGARFDGEKVAWDTVFKAVLAEEERNNHL